MPSLALAALTDGAGAEADAARPLDDMTLEGDPVDVASGDVVLAQTDVTLPGVLPLVLARAHRSSYRAGRWFGRSWASTLDQRLEVSDQAVCFAAADTVVLRYPHPGRTASRCCRSPERAGRWPASGGGYTVTDPQAGTVWRFEPRSGLLPVRRRARGTAAGVGLRPGRAPDHDRPRPGRRSAGR